MGKKKVLGVIGGLGPMATTCFMESVIRMTRAETEQDNLDMIVYNFPSIPDRTGYILGSNLKSPLPGLMRVARELAWQDVAQIAIPCITAHFFLEELRSYVAVPIIDGVRETAKHLKQQGVHAAGIMATEGTVYSGIFTKALAMEGIVPILPSRKRQEDLTRLIYDNVKAGLPPEMRRFRAVERELREGGAEVVVLGCTELSVIKRDCSIGAGFLDAMEVLAQQSILLCGKQLKIQYRDLITKEKQ